MKVNEIMFSLLSAASQSVLSFHIFVISLSYLLSGSFSLRLLLLVKASVAS